MPGCGKEEVLVAAKDVGFSIVRMGDVVREEAQRRGLPITDAAIGGMAHAEREAHGFGIWAERTLPRIHGERVVVEGLRGRAELEVFRKAFGEGLVVVAVHPKRRNGWLGRSSSPSRKAIRLERSWKATSGIRWSGSPAGSRSAQASERSGNAGPRQESPRRSREIWRRAWTTTGSCISGSTSKPRSRSIWSSRRIRIQLTCA